MKKFQVVLDEETDRILNSLAQAHSGDRNLAIREVLRTQGALETLLDQVEQMQSDSLRRQKVRSERGFRKGKFTRWEEVKRKNRL